MKLFKLLLLLSILLLNSCTKELDININSLKGTWWFVPVYEVDKTSIAQIHWNKSGDIIIDFDDDTDYRAYCDIIDGKVYGFEKHLFTIIKLTDIDLTITFIDDNHKEIVVDLITL